MKSTVEKLLFSMFWMTAATLVLFADDTRGPMSGGRFLSTAHAIIGRPLTPMSYAGVARRTTRRAYAAGAVAGGAVVVAPRPACVQVVNPYGQVYWRCP